MARTDLELLGDLVEANTASPKAMDCDYPAGRQILVGPLADVLAGASSRSLHLSDRPTTTASGTHDSRISRLEISESEMSVGAAACALSRCRAAKSHLRLCGSLTDMVQAIEEWPGDQPRPSSAGPFMGQESSSFATAGSPVNRPSGTEWMDRGSQVCGSR